MRSGWAHSSQLLIEREVPTVSPPVAEQSTVCLLRLHTAEFIPTHVTYDGALHACCTREKKRWY
jgi:hypothetical protein